MDFQKSNNTSWCLIPPQILVLPVSVMSSPKKILLGRILALSNEQGFCWASNSYFKDNIGIQDNRSIQHHLTGLEKDGWITRQVDPKTGDRRIYPNYSKIFGAAPTSDVNGNPPNSNAKGSDTPKSTTHTTLPTKPTLKSKLEDDEDGLEEIDDLFERRKTKQQRKRYSPARSQPPPKKEFRRTVADYSEIVGDDFPMPIVKEPDRIYSI